MSKEEGSFQEEMNSGQGLRSYFYFNSYREHVIRH